MQIRSAILDCFAEGYTSAIIDLNENVMQKILTEKIFATELKTRWQDKRIYFVPHKTYKEDHYVVKGDNSSILTLSDKAQILY